MSSRFRFKNSKLKKINKQQENNSEEINISEDFSSDSKNTITRNQTGSKKRRSLIRLSRKHSRKNGVLTQNMSQGNDLNQTALAPIINSQQLTSLGLNSIHSNIVNNGQITTTHQLSNNIHQQLPLLTTSLSSNALTSLQTSNSGGGTMSGYLSKWTNYLKGYQKRWFNLSNGLLSYYRSQTEMAHSCRGTINLVNAVINSEDSCHFIVSNGGTQVFHLKANTESEKLKWVAALESARNRAQQDNPDSDEETNTEAEKNEVQTMLKTLTVKLEDLNTCHDLVQKHSGALTKSLIDLEGLQSKPDDSTLKTINERATLFKITLLAMINACQEFTTLANSQGKKMQKVLQSEHDMRIKLEEMVQEMAKTQSNFETQINKRSNKVRNKDSNQQQQQQNNEEKEESTAAKNQQNKTELTTQNTYTSKSLFQLNEDTNNENNNNDDDDDNEFHDALEDVSVFPITIAKSKVSHKRNSSNLSKASCIESDGASSGDEGDDDDENNKKSTTIQVKMHHTNKDEQQQQQQIVPVKNTPIQLKVRNRRKEIPIRPNYSLNLWGIMKNCIGKDLSKIPIPVNFSEPISMLQRIIEELEYSEVLDRASMCEDQWEQMAYVAAFTISSYSTTATRTNKPFNPILGETFECDRLDEVGFGWRALAEQVSHHPPGLSVHCESIKEWTLYQEFLMSSKFRGQYLQIIPMGTSHLEFKKTGNHYTWRKITTFVRNIIVGKLWIDNVGEMDIINHKTKDVCHLKYFAYSYFSREPPRKVTGIITDSNNVARYVLNGTWTEQIEGAPVLNPQVVTEHTQLNTGASKVLWKRKYPPAHLESMYNFTELAVQLNEPEDNIAPTDSRNRPDQRLMEQALWDEANKEKVRLEDKQRTLRKQREQLNEQLAAENKPQIHHEPLWFKKVIDPYTNQPIHVFKNEYWDCKKKQDWKRCPDLF